ncbi:transposase [Actinomadura madurae]|uniref:transposase n=1 Tax=Actinomadura madurae TaxID=1993 RepID=UPI003999D477
MVAVLQTLNAEIKTLEGQVEAHFGRHPDAEIYLSQPGLGAVLGARVIGARVIGARVLGARVIAEFGDADGRYASAKSRKNYAGTSPTTRQSGRSKSVHARFVHNDRLVDALHMQASAAILHDPAVRGYYNELRARDTGHNAALRQVGNRLVGILHGCLKTRTTYDQATAWSHRTPALAA